MCTELIPYPTAEMDDPTIWRDSCRISLSFFSTILILTFSRLFRLVSLYFIILLACKFSKFSGS